MPTPFDMRSIISPEPLRKQLEEGAEQLRQIMCTGSMGNNQVDDQAEDED
jgi:hypothetical protein